MKILVAILFVSVFFCGCNSNNNIPDVSNIKVELTTQRFEQDLFKIDSAGLSKNLEQVIARYPSFGESFLNTILSVDPRWPADSINRYVGSFVRAYKTIYDSAEKKYEDFTPYEEEIKHALQFVQYYYPQYKLPNKVITYIGPVDGYGDILADDAFLIGLQHHLGKDFPVYKTSLVQETYPEYLSNRFEPDYIAINCIKNITNDLYPEKEEDKPLINQMIDKGKRLYLISKFLPTTDEYKLIGYTDKQLKDCYSNEAIIWNMFVKNNYLQVSDKDMTKNFVEEGPKTQELGTDAPGNIGSFVGWQIVKKYMSKNDKTTLPQLMETDDETIYTSTKYKP